MIRDPSNAVSGAIVRSVSTFLLIGMSSVWGQLGDKKGEPQSELPAAWKEAPAKPLTPEESLRAFQLEKGYRIEVVAHEPAIQDPVAMAFDAFGRLWVVEMRGYMNDLRGLGEDDPVGRVSVLEDGDDDGFFETAKVFLDGLASPRVIMPFGGGVLTTDGKALVHVVDSDADGRGDKRTIVDPKYIESGNVEHSPNGMLLGLDNWFYNAKSKKRYRLRNGKWLIEETESRGQWGITKDDHGRIYYNYNWDQLRGDFVPPNYLTRNPHHSHVAGLNLPIAVDQRVYPIRRNTGVNRGYREGILDERGRLHEFASACAPHVYRGHAMPDLQGDVFVCGPGANILKRNVLIHSAWTLTSHHAYQNRDFLASTDERFRPVNLADGPDGALYLVDFYRGIIQHKDYMTTHLRREIESRNLETPIHWGRLYRILREDSPRTSRTISTDPSSEELVEQLGHEQGWQRDTAQRLLIERGGRAVMSRLREMALRSANPLAKIHAMWALEGLGEKSAPHLLPILEQSTDTQVTVHAIRVLEQCCPDSEAFHRALKALIGCGAPEVRLQIALTLGNLPIPGPVDMLVDLAKLHGDEPLMRDAILSSAHGHQVELMRSLWSSTTFDGDLALLESLGTAMMRSRKNEIIKGLLGILATDHSEGTHRLDAVLSGMTVCARQRRFEPFPLTEALTLETWMKN